MFQDDANNHCFISVVSSLQCFKSSVAPEQDAGSALLNSASCGNENKVKFCPACSSHNLSTVLQETSSEPVSEMFFYDTAWLCDAVTSYTNYGYNLT